MKISVDPVAFTIGPTAVRWYGIFIALAIAWIVVWMVWQRKRGANFTYDTIFTGALVGIPSGVIISRLLHVLDNIVVAKLHPEIAGAFDYTQDPIKIFGGAGLTIYGAVLGAALGIWIFCRISKLDMRYVSHFLAPAVISAQAIGRIGCTLNGCCYGIACNLPWCVEYTHPDTEAARANPGITVHPTQIYEIIFNLIVFGVLWKLMSKVRPDGSLFLIYLALYSAWRVGIDFLRPGNPFLFGLHQAQIIGIVVLVITIPILARRFLRARTAKPLQQEVEVS